ncbi:low molecular weight protein-tyrosine-phosphatase [Elizabethkingia sp. JS20170427COW]|uniref:low molecular weight protein-tyrosine-phosphatase n=1 Tax=Elizabethkingia sp. JS20170427COW TaxID=2583851 RepID=UPI0011104B80|nr:low molecular weight protein-tyrosine-phosphatase [Elizabethkingia sp. JS20170427COW]QCX53715.1 low molecular weight phosphotyrosine protein phosphatase [Elizabethkingia sp. JS20170427COW]
MKILMVCLGNICRSPLAEGIMKSKLPRDFFVDSAGTSAFHRGELPDVRSIKTAEKHHLDITDQRSRPIEISDLEEFDYIFCMDGSNFKNVQDLAQNDAQRSKIHLILEILKNPKLKEVPDPYYGGDQGFENVYQMLDRACELWAEQLIP